jgi:hypothetical protein
MPHRMLARGALHQTGEDVTLAQASAALREALRADDDLDRRTALDQERAERRARRIYEQAIARYLKGATSPQRRTAHTAPAPHWGVRPACYDGMQ